MRTSESIVNICKALVAASKDITHAHKDAKNPHFKSSYATLESVIDASKEALFKNDIVVIQAINDKSLVTRLVHSSGEFVESSFELIVDKMNMQALGSSCTYARRYSLAAMLNIAQTDDDGNASVAAANRNHNTNQQSVGVKIPDDIGEYVIKFGKKMMGKKMSDFSMAEHNSMLKYLDQNIDGIRGPALEYYEIAKRYVAGPPVLDTSEKVPL